MLGMARTLIVRPDTGDVISRWRGPRCVTDQQLKQAAQLVLQPEFARLEAVRLVLGPPSLGRSFDRLMYRLPASCIRLELETDGLNAEALRKVANALPKRFSELRLGVPDQAILERLGNKLLSLELTTAVGPDQVTRLADLVPKGMQLIVGGISSAACLEFGGARLRLGRSGDAVLTDQRTGEACVLRRTSAELLQRRFGVLGARAQLGRGIPEKWSIRDAATGVGIEAIPSGANNVMRHSDGNWTLAESSNSATELPMPAPARDRSVPTPAPSATPPAQAPPARAR